MTKLIDFFRGASDANPGIEEAEVNAAKTILDLHKKDPVTGEVKDINEDEDKNAKIDEIVAGFADILDEEDVKKLRDSLIDLAYSKSTGEDEIDERMNGENEIDTAEAVNLDEEDERKRLMCERAEDVLKLCGMDADSDEIKAAFAKGFEYGMHDGEKDMRNPVEREKLDKEHESEGMRKLYAQDSNALVKQVEKSIAAKYDAAREVEMAVGSVSPLAFDSADEIYAYALAQMGRPIKNKLAARDVFHAVIDTRKQTIALDANPFFNKKYSGNFAGLYNLKV